MFRRQLQLTETVVDAQMFVSKVNYAFLLICSKWQFQSVDGGGVG